MLSKLESLAHQILGAKRPRRNLGVWDEEFRGEDRQQTLFDRTRHQQDQWIQSAVKDEVYVNEKSTSVANIDRQLGRPMTFQVFKGLVERANSRLKVEPHPWCHKVVVYELKNMPPDHFDPVTKLFGGLQKVTRMVVGGDHSPLLPEWSVMSTREEKVPAKSRYEPMKTVMVPNFQIARGWRAGLALLVQGELMTREVALRAADKYGSEDRLSWQAATGGTAKADYLH
jgi:hypothetical protein